MAFAEPSSAWAAEQLAPLAASEQPLRIWYRSSEGCPDGPAFIALLGRLGRSGSLAGVGDRVDFVVTVAYAPAQSSGRLERQSNEGTVAIRDVAARSCAEVADALALSLDLALEPGAQRVAAEAPAPWQLRLGAQGQLTSGLAGAVLAGAALFAELGRSSPAWSARLSLWGARGVVDDAAVDVRLGQLGSRLEACWTWSVGALGLSPCAGVELGTLAAEGEGDGGRSDTGLWSSAVAHLRASWHMAPSVALEAQAGLQVPFVRYHLDALTGVEVADSAAVGLAGALGLSFIP